MSARKFSMFVTCAMNLKRVILKDMATPTASTIPSSNLLKTGSSGPKIKILRSTKKTDYQQYTLPQKKRNFNFQIFHGNPGPGSVTPGHVHQGKPQIFRHTLFSKRKAPFNLAVGIQFRERMQGILYQYVPIHQLDRYWYHRQPISLHDIPTQMTL